MLFKLTKDKHAIKRIRRKRLDEIGWKEEDLQRLLFDNLEEVLPDEELMLISQSRKWQEEPDLMAIDPKGELYIFEIKAWESKEENLLQVLRYGQIYGQYTYEKLDDLFSTFSRERGNLLDQLNAKFGVNLTVEQINRRQHFVVITNGRDFNTRRGIQYWSQKDVKIRSWLYRIYEVDHETVVEFDKFRLTEDPDEDIEQGYWILNTNYSKNRDCDKEMLAHHKAAAYYHPWRKKIEYLQPHDKVFLYRSGEGIVAAGIVSGKLERGPYPGDEESKDDAWSKKLTHFKILKRPLAASDIKKIGGRDYRFMQTMFGPDEETGETLWRLVKGQ